MNHFATLGNLFDTKQGEGNIVSLWNENNETFNKFFCINDSYELNKTVIDVRSSCIFICLV